MSVRTITKLGFAAVLLGAAACEFGVEKSANPLSPSIAGPLPGVTITAPRPVEPINGVEVLTTSLPVRLVFENATSNSPRPFWQIVELAADAGFSNRLYTSERLNPDSSGRTTHTIPSSLAHDVTYYWRVRAEDGANASDPSAVVYFQVVEPVIIDPPVPVSPVGGTTTANRSPDFVVANGNVSGPAGTVTYKFEVGNDLGFTSLAATGTTTRSGGSTTTLNLGQLAENRLFYWRALGTNGKVTSAYSAIQSFRTPAVAVPTPGGPCNAPGSPVNWTNGQWHDCFFSLVEQKGVGPYVTYSALVTLKPDLNALGADWQHDGAGYLRPRLYLPTGNPNDPWSRAVDVGDWNGPWLWIPR